MGSRQFDDFLYQRYLTRAKQLLAEFNRKMSVLGTRESPFCKEGCAHCCNHIFFVSSAEIDIIAAQLLQDEMLLARFIERAAQRERQLMNHAELLNACEDPGEAGSLAAQNFMRLKIPCALLDNDRCQIYEIRPMTCASFVSIVPPRICASDPKGSMSAAMNQLLAETRQALRKLSKSIGGAHSDRLDISRQVLKRLAEIGRIPASP
ncbi:MAG: YkgJ family cysteine cluster protein [Desulfuromonadales bacterium]|nr:YkgJ family cysteine cluster protein [Desulfuromonadales bacterium]